MLSDTLAAELGRYRIGDKVRALRKQKSLGLVQLGEHTGLSPALLSKIERGQLVPTLPTLTRIALVFGVGLEHFFDSSERASVAIVRRGDRLRLPERPGSPSPAYWFESLDFPATDRRMEAYLADFPPGAPASTPHQHAGSEFVYVLAGRLVVALGESEFGLDTGDAAHFRSGAEHSYRSEGAAGARALVVVAA